MFKISINKFWVFIFSLYFVTRLVNLGIIPIFTDEAIYTYWAQVALHDPANRYISLTDGKQPLFIWISAIIQKFVDDPLIATRLTSVLSGAFAVLGIYLVSKALFNQNVARLAAILYVVLPFTLLYDRLGIFDSLLTMLGIYSTYFSIRLVKTPRLDLALLNGIVIGLALITKSTGFFFLYLLPAPLLLFDLYAASFRIKFLKWLFFSAVTFVCAQIIYNSLRLSPYFYLISRKNLEFIRPASEILNKPFAHFSSNIATIFGWFLSYLTLPLLVTFLLGLAYYLFKKNLKIFLLFIYISFPMIVEGMINKVLYPRFSLFYFPFMIIVTAFIIFSLTGLKIKSQKYLKLLIALIFVYPIVNSLLLITAPTNAKIASSDSDQYLNSWPAGYGVSETVKLIKHAKLQKPVYVATEGTFGLLPYALQIYFYGENNVAIEGFWPVDPQNIPNQVLDNTKENLVYFVFNENQTEIINPRLKLLEKYQKGKGFSFLRIYEVIP